MAPPFSVATYNVLADAYIRPQRYPNTPASLLVPQERMSRLIRRILDLDADVVCLQEADIALYQALSQRFDQATYLLPFARKAGGKPDGCITIVKTSSLSLRSSHVLYYSDGGDVRADSGHLALVTVLEQPGKVLAIANTHLKWDPPDTPPEAQWAYRQISQLLRCERIAPDAAAWIVCGDLNVRPDSATVRAIRDCGFRDAFDGDAAAHTCVANGKAQKVDYLFMGSALAARPAALPRLDDATPLPSMIEPSDHLPLRADFDWQVP